MRLQAVHRADRAEGSTAVRHLAWTIAVIVAIAACGGSAQPSATPAAAILSPSASALPSSSPSALPATVPPRSAPPPPTPTPMPTRVAPPTPAPTKRPRPTAVAMREQEQWLVHTLRADVAERCEPRRSGLPAGAVAGIECEVDAPFVDRVGVYSFDADPRAA